jgi:mannitol/fructose-specific phosphotransferase system IIA component (Ntr-type)
MALATSLVSGPAMKLLLRGAPEEESIAGLVRAGGWVADLKATSAREAVAELVAALASRLGNRAEAALKAVLDREAMAPTGLGEEVAVPHATVEGLPGPMLALGHSRGGVDFNAVDGVPAKLVFLLLMPPRAHDQEVRILASIARAVITIEAREKLLRAKTLAEALTTLAVVEVPPGATRPRRASLADI